MESFDAYAENYDQHFTSSPIGVLQRKRVFKFLKPYLDKEKNVLEINCGTGYDACIIAPQVKQMLATDISGEMIRQAEKRRQVSARDNLEFSIKDARTIKELPLNTIDLLYSNFAGLNCLSPFEMKIFADDVTSQLKNKTHIFLVLLSTKCIWEDFYFFIKRDARLKRRRQKFGVKTSIGENLFNTYYYTPKEICDLFGDNYKVELLRPIGLFIPPSYLNPFFTKLRFSLKILQGLEMIFGGFSVFSNRADHYLIVLKKID